MESTKDIWFIDDDETFRFVMKHLMQDTAYADAITYFDDGDRAVLKLVEMAKTGKSGPKLIFLDLSMKYLEGWQLIDLMNEFKVSSKVAILTSSIHVKDKTRAAQEPLVTDFLTKPVSREQIIQVIEKSLA
jgi:DNA-binding NtrC family response regulator